MNNYFKDYISNFRKALDAISTDEMTQLFQYFRDAAVQGKQIFVFGNGGSAMSASHFATDMSKGASDAIGKPLKVISLNDNMGLVTAISNDYSFDDVFYRQLKVLANPGDLVLTLSVSGSSPNLVKAVKWAKDNGLVSVALIGGSKGTLASVAECVLTIDSKHYGQVEDLHMMICHMISFGFIDNPDKALTT